MTPGQAPGLFKNTGYVKGTKTRSKVVKLPAPEQRGLVGDNEFELEADGSMNV